jgi:ubiquinone/menaquinone biosynthesis C-methylase UbiE
MKFILKYIAKQFKNPTGFGGKLATSIMNRQNKKLYQLIICNINIRETDTILDIGFGNGYLIRELLKQNLEKIYGIEISSDMIGLASNKNRKEIDSGKLQLTFGDVQNIPLESSSINKAYTINTVYFWNDIEKGFSEIKRVLKPNGIFLNVLYAKEYLDKLPITQYGYSKYTAKQIEKITTNSGLKIENVLEIELGKAICIIARKER